MYYITSRRAIKTIFSILNQDLYQAENKNVKNWLCLENQIGQRLS